jgi:hypothetical protein
MSKIVMCAAVSALLLGCGATSTEVALGDAVLVSVDKTPSGAGRVQVSVGTGSCRSTEVAFSWAGSGKRAQSLVVRSSGEEC